MEKRRDEIGKLLACLLVSRKGVCDLRNLERDFQENEGKAIPFKEFGYSSSLDFFRSISNHIRLVPRSGSYVVYPVVSDKIKHVNELVSRQKCGKRQAPVGRRPNRFSQYYPPVREQKPFVPNSVQKEIAQILTQNPRGVNKSYIAQCLEQSKAVAGNVNVNNIDDYLRGMPYTAVARGNMVYPSRSLISTTTNTVKRNIPDIDGFEIVMPGDSESCNEGRNNNSQDMNCCPAGAEEDEIINEDEYRKENTQPQSSNVDNNHAAYNDYEYHQASRTGNDNRPRISSAEFIDRAGSQYIRSQCDVVLREDENGIKNYLEGVGSDDVDNEEQDVNYRDNANCTFESDDDGSLDIVSPRVKTRLQQLIKQFPDGLWCADLLQAYSDQYKVPLDYVDLGFGSVCEFASHLPKIFHLHRQNNRGDFRLYDATKPLPMPENKSESHISSNIWEDEDCNDDVDPFPMALPLDTSQSLIPHGVMTHGESVGQERIPEIHDGSDCLEIYVVEVYTPSLFWIHLRKQRSKLSQLMESMHDFYQREGDNYNIPHVILEKGLNCVCTFEDKWHRAIIKTVKPDGNVTLVFYDYGTTQTYPPNSVRFLVRTYSNLPAQAIPCGLYNVKPVNANAWTRGASSEFYSRVADLPLVAMVVKVDKENNSMLVSLVDTQGDTDDHINDWLVHAGLAESGFMVRSRPSNFVFRHYIASVNYCYEMYVRSQRLEKRVKVNSRANSRNSERSDSESGTSSKEKLKAANYAKNLMARHSKYQKENLDNVPKNSSSEAEGANSRANLNPIVYIRQGVKDCSSTDVSALPEINPSLENSDKNHISKMFRKKLNLMNSKRYDYEHLETIAGAHRVSCKQSANNNPISAQSVENFAQSSDDSDLRNETPEVRAQEFVKNEDAGGLEFSGTFRSFYGGHGYMEPIDWSKLRNDILLKQETKSQAIAEFPSWKLYVENEEKAETNQRTDKYSDNLSKESLHHGMVSDFRKVTVESVDKKIEKIILPAKDCFINAVRSNKDHYYSVHGEMLWWSTDGNIQDKPGEITPLLRKRKQNFIPCDAEVSASSEILQMLRGEKLLKKETGAIPKYVSDPELDFISQLKRMADPCAARISNLTEIENVETSMLQKKIPCKTLTPLKEYTSQTKLSPKLSNSTQSAGSGAMFHNGKDDCKKLNALSNTRFATCLNYFNKKKKQKEYSVSAESSAIESSLDTNSIETDFSNTSNKISNLQEDFGTSYSRELNYIVKKAEENYTISQNQESSNTHNSNKNLNYKSDSLVSANVQTVSESDELSEHNSDTVAPDINESLENFHPTPSKNQDTIATVNTTNVESISKGVICSNSPDENGIDIQVCGLPKTDAKFSKLRKISQNYSKFCESTDSTSELDSDDLSHSCSNSETDIDLTKNIEPDTVDNEETSAITGESSLDNSNDIQEQCEHDNMLVNPDNKKEMEVPVFKNESKIFAPIVNDLESMADSDEWDVHGDWRNLIEDESHFMSRVVRQLKIKNNSSESARITEVDDKSELDDVVNIDDLQYDQISKPITQKIHEEKCCKIQDTIDDKNSESNARIANGHYITNLEASENSSIDSLDESEVISNEKLPTHSNEDNKLIATITNSTGDQYLSQCNETVIDNINNEESSGEITTQDNDSTAMATTSKKKLGTREPMSKTKSMYDMLKNFKSKQNLDWVNSDLKKVDNSLHTKANTDKVISEIDCDENVESDINTFNEDEERGEMNAEELFSGSEMFVDSFNTSSSSQGSISVISNAMAGNQTDSNSTQYIKNRENQHCSPEQHSTSDENSDSSSSDAIKFIEGQSPKPRTQFPILSRVKKQQLSVKSPTKDLGVQSTSQTDVNTVSEKGSILSNESFGSNNSLSRSFLHRIKSMYL